jgi:hypothetical protein
VRRRRYAQMLERSIRGFLVGKWLRRSDSAADRRLKRSADGALGDA